MSQSDFLNEESVSGLTVEQLKAEIKSRGSKTRSKDKKADLQAHLLSLIHGEQPKFTSQRDDSVTSESNSQSTEDENSTVSDVGNRPRNRKSSKLTNPLENISINTISREVDSNKEELVSETCSHGISQNSSSGGSSSPIQLTFLPDDNLVSIPVVNCISQLSRKDRIQNLINAAVSDLGLLVNLLESEDYIEVIDDSDEKEGYTPLMWAAKAGNLKGVELICNIKPEARNTTGGWGSGTTALMKSVEKRDGRNRNIILRLVEQPANLDIMDKYGMTALMYAAEQKDISLSRQEQQNSCTVTKAAEIIRILLSKGANPNLQNKKGYTALILAAQIGEYEAVQALLDRELPVDIMADYGNDGSDDATGARKRALGLEIKNSYGKTALLLAAEEGRLDVVRILVERGASVDARSTRGLTALMLAAVKKNKDVVKYLVSEARVDVTVECEAHDTALIHAFKGGSVSIVKIILKCHDGEIPLHTCFEAFIAACTGGQKEVVDIMLDKITSGLSARAGAERLQDILFEKNDAGFSCLMAACQYGRIATVSELMFCIKKIMNELCAEEADVDENILDSTYFTDTNKEGKTALDLLAAFYRANDVKLSEYFEIATAFNAERPYVLDMLPHILPICKSPIKVMNQQFEVGTFERLKGLRGIDADVQLLGALVNFAKAFKMSAQLHYGEKKDLMDLTEKVEGAMVECMSSHKLDVPDNINMVLLRIRDVHRGLNPDVVQQARCIRRGPLFECIMHDLTKLLATPQIISHISDVFNGSLKSRRVDIVRSIPDLFQLRAGTSTKRFQPSAVYFFECCSKVLFLFVVTAAALCHGGEPVDSRADVAFFCTLASDMIPFHFMGKSDKCCNIRGSVVLAVMAISMTMYEVGEIADRWSALPKATLMAKVRSFSVALKEHYSNLWNRIDTLIIIFTWLFILFDLFENSELGYIALAWNAMFLSLSLLRFTSVFPSIGQLVIMIFSMMSHLGGYAVVFLICLVGFGIAFMSLFSGDLFSSAPTTFLTMFDMASGDTPNREAFKSTGEFTRINGIFMAIVFTVFVSQVLSNLIGARMNKSHDIVDCKSLEIWSKIMALNTKEYAVLQENHALAMLPPPLNLFSLALSFKSVQWSGYFTDVVYGLLASPYDSFKEVWLMYNALCVTSGATVETQLVIGIVAAVAVLPVLVIMYFVLIFWNILTEEKTLIDPITKRIKFAKALDVTAIPIEATAAAQIITVERGAMKLVDSGVAILFVCSHALLQYLAPPFIDIFFGLVYTSTGRESSDPSSIVICLRVWVCVWSFVVLRFLHIDMWLTVSPLARYMYACDSADSCHSTLDSKARVIGMASMVHATVAVFAISVLCYFKLLGMPASTSEMLRKFSVLQVCMTTFLCLVFGGFEWKDDPIHMPTPLQLLCRYRPIPACDATIGGAVAGRDHISAAVDAAVGSDKANTRYRTEQESAHTRYRQLVARPAVNTADVSTGGVFEIKLIRGSISRNNVSIFGRVVNPYVLVTYAGKTWNCGPSSDHAMGEKGTFQWNFPLKIVHDESIGNQEMLFEIFDKSDTYEKTLVYDPELGHVNVNVKDWIERKRFEDTLKLFTPTCKPDGGTIQLFVRVTYPEFEAYVHEHTEVASACQAFSPRTPRLQRRSSFTSQNISSPDFLFTFEDRDRIFKKIIEN